jgi:putative ABC transport system permease protein
MEGLLQDIRYALRMLARSRGFTAVAVLTLALGIGANTAIFSVVSPILFERLPYPHANRIMVIWDVFQGSRSDVTFHTYRELAARNRLFEALSILERWRPTMTGPNEPGRLEGQSVSANYFRVLGVSPMLGRGFQASDEVHHGPKVVLLSAGLWERRFGSDPRIVGHRVTFDGDSYEIVGVMPRGVEDVLAPATEVWTPAQYNTANINDRNSAEWGHHLRMFGRLRPGISKTDAARELTAIANTPVAEFPRVPWAALKFGFIVESLQDDMARGVKPALLAVFGAVMLVLIIACVNVTNLLLARGAQRRTEFAMRAALGAGSGRMLRQLLTESLLLSAVGGALGMVVAQMGVRALVALSPADLPRLGAISLNGTVFVFAAGITALIGVAVGLVPAVYASRSDLQQGIQRGSKRITGTHQTTRRALVVAEVGLAFVVLVSAGLLLHSLRKLLAVDPGFQPLHVLSMQVQTSGHKFDDPAVTKRFFREALEQANRVPGVISAAFTSLLPLSEKRETATANTYGAFFENDQHSYDVFLYTVTPLYFETMRIPLRRGRFLDNSDASGASQAVLISESLAKREFGSEDPLGQRMHVGPMDRPWYIVAGVVGNVKQNSLAVNDLGAVYITPEQQWFADDAMSLVVRAQDDSAALVPAIRNAIWSVDKDQAIVRIATMDGLVAASAAERRFVLILFEGFGIVALVLAATGIYGVLSGSVSERVHEIGVRAALGASRASILGLIVGQGMRLTVLGIVIGLGGAFFISRALASLLFGVSELDPIAYIGVVGLLAVVAAAACWAPAWRATKVDPVVALRHE